MVSPCNPSKVYEYLLKNDYLDTFLFLISSADNLNNRAALLDKKSNDLLEKMRHVTDRVSSNPEEAIPENPEFSSLIKGIHYDYLDAIMQLNILIELLAVYCRKIRDNLRELPQCIGKNDFPTRELYDEFERFLNLSITDICDNFHYPNVQSFLELSNDERRSLKKLLDKSLQKIQEAFTKIYWFQDNFRDVYNKYKHTLSEFTGVFGLDRATMSLQTEVYVRHKERDRIYTYMIPVSPDDVRYLREIAVRVYHMLNALIENALLHIVNEGRDFVPKTLFIDEEDRTEFVELSGKIQSCIAPDFRSKVIVRPPEVENVDRINRDLKEKHLRKMDKDILDPSSLLKEGVKVTK